MGWWVAVPHLWGGEPFRPRIALYLRYIDDLLKVVTNGRDLLDPLLSYLNDNNKNLSFTGVANPREMYYLDVCLTGEGLEVSTTLNRKPLSGNTLLSAQSGHPKHTIKGIPVGQFLRLKRICSNDLQFDKESSALYKRFLDRGYPSWMLNRALNIPKNKVGGY